jgi:isopentenyl diphosphate isomerase/L-lactate dehydrogenase-like FMN-dependent dehydrogenase
VRALRLRCPACGELDVPADEVVVTRHGPANLSYAFSCPRCLAMADKDCDTRVGRLLLLSGARSDQDVAAGLAAFGPDHVAKLRARLEQPDWFEQFRAAS